MNKDEQLDLAGGKDWYPISTKSWRREDEKDHGAVKGIVGDEVKVTGKELRDAILSNENPA